MPLVNFEVIPYGMYVRVCPVECYVRVCPVECYVRVCPVECYVLYIHFTNSSTNAHCRLQSHDYSNEVGKSHMNSNDMQDNSLLITWRVIAVCSVPSGQE